MGPRGRALAARRHHGRDVALAGGDIVTQREAFTRSDTCPHCQSEAPARRWTVEVEERRGLTLPWQRVVHVVGACSRSCAEEMRDGALAARFLEGIERREGLPP
jgi:hypothetical protein